jgi:hypothetical protein
MNNKTLSQIEKKIEKIKQQLVTIQQMRPGSLTRQYRNPKDKTGAYYQISYTHKMKSRTEYVRSEFIDTIEEQISEYKHFRELIDQWVELSIEHSKMQMAIAKKTK